MFDDEKLRSIGKYAQMHVVQIITASFLSLALGFMTCKVITKPCVREVVCKEIISDRDKLSVQLSEARKNCLDEKSELGKALKDKFIENCNLRVKDAVKNCDFSEKHHCPICKARGVCK
tara:strand:- start:553 stop:909 length:357 start_codon:yes stop_codon:yes gene_type:complete